MTYYPDDLEDKVSKCCFATLITTTTIRGKQVLRCGDCGDATEPVDPPCPLGICDGSGLVPVYDSVEPGAPSYQADTKPCPHLTD